MATATGDLTHPAAINRTRKANEGPYGLDDEPCLDPTDFNAGIWSRAFQKWNAAGCPAGDGARFWREAEREILQGR